MICSFTLEKFVVAIKTKIRTVAVKQSFGCDTVSHLFSFYKSHSRYMFSVLLFINQISESLLTQIALAEYLFADGR